MPHEDPSQPSTTPMATTAQSLIADAANVAAQLSVDASVVAREVVNRAAEAAEHESERLENLTSSMLSKVDEKLREHHEENKTEMKNAVLEVLGNVFGTEESTYIVKNRVPLLCQSVVSMKESITEIKEMLQDLPNQFVNQDQFGPVKLIVFGLAGLCMTAVIVALLAMVIKQ